MKAFVQNLKCEYSEKITALLQKKFSFALSGITNCAKLIILAQLLIKNNKKLVFVTETEQSALKYQNDLKNLFDIELDFVHIIPSFFYDFHFHNDI